jgi:hypothetical protein
MRLSSQKAFLLLAATIACHDSTTGPSTIDAAFALQAINGRPLPTYIAATPGNTATVLSASLALDDAGKAIMTEHRQDVFQGDVNLTTTFKYTIHGNKIDITLLEPCPANANCISGFTGTISSEGLELLINPSSQFPVIYEYRLTASQVFRTQ